MGWFWGVSSLHGPDALSLEVQSLGAHGNLIKNQSRPGNLIKNQSRPLEVKENGFSRKLGHVRYFWIVLRGDNFGLFDVDTMTLLQNPHQYK